MKRWPFLAAVTASLIGAPPASADYLAPQIISSVPGAQSNGPTSSVSLSADGHYAAFISSASNLYPDAEAAGRVRTNGGVFRKDLATGALELVVPSQIRDTAFAPPRLLGGLATATEPSMSEDGRLVTFATTLPLAPEDTNAATDVYVRDMSIPMGEAGAFTLVSAIDGGTAPLSYAAPAGSLATRQAISEDGTRVAFQVIAASNVGDMTATATTTPDSQVVVRDIPARRTIVLSTTRAEPHAPAPNQTVVRGPGTLRVALSGDGSTVIWLADTASTQVPGNAQTDAFGELLWKRVADGSRPTARLVVGLNDPDDPDCVPGTKVDVTTLVPGPCDSPVGQPRDTPAIGATASLTRDGNRVVIGAPPRTGTSPAGLQDLYWVDMTPGLSRKQATHRLTAGVDAGSGGAGVTWASVSPDGRWISFAASRWTPALNPPTPIGSFGPPTTQQQVYVVDLARGTVELVSQAFDGSGGSNGDSSAPSISNGGARVGFVSKASNLFFGDANNAADAVVASQPVLTIPTSTVELPAPLSAPALVPNRRLIVTSSTLASGAVRLRVSTPDPGAISIVVRRQALVRASKRKAPAQPRVTPVARALSPGGVTNFDLRAAKKYVRDVGRPGGLPAIALVTFTAAGHPTLTSAVAIKFKRNPLAKSKRDS